jgi:hypothetical protein
MSTSDQILHAEGLERLQEAIQPYRQQLLQHSLYSRLDSLPALQKLMEQHAFAVFDFMSLLKALQRELTSITVPWLPSTCPIGARLVNEIVLGEETDEDGAGGFASHFELYHRSMQACGASTEAIDRFTEKLREGRDWRAALEAAGTTSGVQVFLSETFRVIESGDVVAMAASFTFGREDLLPDVFVKLVEELDRQTGGDLAPLRYYLQRHIELDGDEHGPMAHRLLQVLCGDRPTAWEVATQAAVSALKARLVLWDSIADAVAAQHA